MATLGTGPRSGVPVARDPRHEREGIMTDECACVAEGDGFQPTEWAVGPWSADTLQGSAYGGLLVRPLERSDASAGMILGRLSFDLWRPVARERLTSTV